MGLRVNKMENLRILREYTRWKTTFVQAVDDASVSV